MRHRVRPAAQAAGFLPEEVRHSVLRTQQDADPDGEAAQPGTGRGRTGQHQTLPQTGPRLHQPYPFERRHPDQGDIPTHIRPDRTCRRC